MSNNVCQIAIIRYFSDYANYTPTSGVTVSGVNFYLKYGNTIATDYVSVNKNTKITLSAYGGSNESQGYIYDKTGSNTVVLKQGVGSISYSYTVTKPIAVEVKLIRANNTYASEIHILNYDDNTFEPLMFFKGERESSLDYLPLKTGGLYHCFDSGRTFLATGETSKLLFATNAEYIEDLVGIEVTTEEVNRLKGINDNILTLLGTKLSLSGGTMTGAINTAQGPGKGINLGKQGYISATCGSTTNATILSALDSNKTLTIGNTGFNLRVQGAETRPVYNNSSLALLSDIEDSGNDYFLKKGSFVNADSALTWGVLGGNNYQTVTRWDSSNGGSVGFADGPMNDNTWKARTSMQIDGYFYQVEGLYRVLDESDIGGTVGYHSKFTGAHTLGNSLISDDGSCTTIHSRLVVKGNGSSYNEGIRILPASNQWSNIYFSGDTSTSGESSGGGWLIGRRGITSGSYTNGTIGDFTIEGIGSEGKGVTIKQNGDTYIYGSKFTIGGTAASMVYNANNQCINFVFN